MEDTDLDRDEELKRPRCHERAASRFRCGNHEIIFLPAGNSLSFTITGGIWLTFGVSRVSPFLVRSVKRECHAAVALPSGRSDGADSRQGDRVSDARIALTSWCPRTDFHRSDVAMATVEGTKIPPLAMTP